MPALSTLVDNFDDNTINTTLWPGNYGTTAETGGRARLTCDTSFNAYVSASTYTFDSFFLRAFPAAANGATSTCYLSTFLASAGQPAGTNVGFSIDTVAGTLSLINWVGFSDAGLVTLTYDSTAHAWLRVAASGGTLVWQTSPDGSTWTTRRSTSTPAWLAAATDVKIFFEAHRDAGTTNVAEVDNFNVAPAATLTLTAATATTTAVAATPVPQPVTVPLTAAGTAWSALAVTPTPRPVTLTTTPATAGWSAAVTTPVPQPVTTAVIPAIAAWSATTLVPVPGAVTVPLTPATAVWSVVPVSAGSALATVPLSPAAAQWTAQPVALSVSPITSRPNTGRTTRPFSGITSRPYAGTTPRP